ncbi:MAG: hypothetical protein WKF66_15840 [Pedobacter sp.]
MAAFGGQITYIYVMSLSATWQEEQRALLNQKSVGLNEASQKKYGIDYISGAIAKVPLRSQGDEQKENFRLKTESLISIIPIAELSRPDSVKLYLKELSSYRAFILKEFNMVSKGHHLARWMPLGVAIGVAFGVALKNIGIGIAVGIGMGVAIGSGLDTKAEKEGRLI